MTDSLYMSLNNIRVVPQNLPCTVRGFVVQDDMDGYCIIVNARLSQDQQRKTVKHELDHIRNGEVGDPAYVEY